VRPRWREVEAKTPSKGRVVWGTGGEEVFEASAGLVFFYFMPKR
jgi:hypothetical protein